MELELDYNAVSLSNNVAQNERLKSSWFTKEYNLRYYILNIISNISQKGEAGSLPWPQTGWG